MEKSTVVQIVNNSMLDKSMNGCLGFVKVYRVDGISTISIYHPQERGKNAFVKDFEIPNESLFEVGTPKIKPV